MLAGGGIVARLLVDYPQFLPNSYVGFLIYRAGPTIVLLWACAAATIAVSPLAKRLVLLSASCGSIVAVLSLAALCPMNERPRAAPCQRSEERRVGKEGVSPCRYRWSLYH